jgi:hypothetical protein
MNTDEMEDGDWQPSIPEGDESSSPALADAVGLRWVNRRNDSSTLKVLDQILIQSTPRIKPTTEIRNPEPKEFSSANCQVS